MAGRLPADGSAGTFAPTIDRHVGRGTVFSSQNLLDVLQPTQSSVQSDIRFAYMFRLLPRQSPTEPSGRQVRLLAVEEHSDACTCAA